MKSVMQKNKEICWMCFKSGKLHPHHIFNGALRKKSEQYGYIVYVHDLPCHRLIHDNPAMAKELKKMAQTDFEKSHTREEFIKIFKKSYL